MTIETILRRLEEGRGRVWAPTIVTLGIGLIIILPATDEFNTARENRDRLRAGLAKARQEVARLDEVEKKAAAARQRVDQLQMRTVSAGEVHLFRQEVVEMARRQGCQIRRIRVGDRRRQPWEKEDDPLEAISTKQKRNAEAPYLLNAQSMAFSVSGTLASVKHLLEDLRTADRTIHTENLSLSPTRGKTKEVVLDFELLLFDLTKAEAAPG